MTPSSSAASAEFHSRAQAHYGKPEAGWRSTLFSVIFESDSRTGRIFDLMLIALILTSVLVVVLDSVESISQRWGSLFTMLEWGFTGLFTVEYVLRLICVNRPLRYVGGFFGIVDLLALLPTWLAIFVPQLSYLLDVRILRLLRIFRIFKLSRYANESRSLVRALAASRRKIMVFLGFVMLVVLVMGTLMYVVEGPAHGFTSIPTSIYWAITTLATVGFGDLVPQTGLGRFIASLMMLLGWGTLAVPTGILTAEITRRGLQDEPDGEVDGPMSRGLRAAVAPLSTQRNPSCPHCDAAGHAADARYCRCCGTALVAAPPPCASGASGAASHATRP